MGTSIRTIITVLSLVTLVSCAEIQDQPKAGDNANGGNAFEETIANQDEAGGQASIEAIEILNSQLSLPLDQQQNAREHKPIPEDLKHLDPAHLIPAEAFRSALDFFITYRSKFRNQRFLGVIDFHQKSSAGRFYLVDLRSGNVGRFLVAHGKNSDPNFSGFATRFSNQDGSLMSSIGAYMVAETYTGKHGLSVRLDGLEASNSNARARAIVLHAADYVNANQNPVGRSFGCPAVDFKYRDYLIAALNGGSLLYAYF